MSVPDVDRTRRELSDGSPVTPDHREIDPQTGQQKGYVVLSQEERARGFVRPLRRTYVHTGVRPKHPLRDLTDAERDTYGGEGFVKYEEYPESERPSVGRFWTERDLKSGCGSTTTMGLPIAETYARDPGFYGGTFCCQCRAHFPLAEFVWEGTSEVVGS